MKSPRIAFWTHFLDPEHEAISKEVWALHRAFPLSFIFGLSRHYWFRFSWKERYVGFHYTFFFLFRVFALFFQRFYCLQHIYSDLGAWHFLKVLKRKPLVLSIVTDSPALPAKMYDRVDLFIVQSAEQSEKVFQAAGPESKVEIILPGIDLKNFQLSSVPPDTNPFSVLFASVPILPKEYSGRGMDLLLALARQFPEIRFLIAWRSWGASPRELIRYWGTTPPANIEIRTQNIPDMTQLYREVHATIAPFRRSGGKPFPHSIMESLACGRPVLVSNEVAISEIIHRENSGEVFVPEVKSAAEAIGRLQARYHKLAANARPCAEKYFSSELFVKKYSEVYLKLEDSGRTWKKKS